MTKTTGNKFLIIGSLGLLTGTLDAIAAIIIAYPASPSQIFSYIASGLFGARSASGNNMILWGILFHYLIATLFSVAFFTLHPKFKGLTKNKYLLGIIYGLLIWIVMNLAILPLTNVPKQPERLHINWLAILKGVSALIISVGIPISVVAERYYIKQARRRSRRHKHRSA